MHSVGIAQFEQAVGGMGKWGDVGMGVTTATCKPVCISSKSREFSFGKVVLRNVFPGKTVHEGIEEWE